MLTQAEAISTALDKLNFASGENFNVRGLSGCPDSLAVLQRGNTRHYTWGAVCLNSEQISFVPFKEMELYMEVTKRKLGFEIKCLER